jgi:hypothetical protein
MDIWSLVPTMLEWEALQNMSTGSSAKKAVGAMLDRTRRTTVLDQLVDPWIV